MVKTAQAGDLEACANLVSKLVACHQYQRELVQCHKMCLPDSVSIDGDHVEDRDVPSGSSV